MKASFPSGSESSSPLRENGSGGSPALSLNWRRFSADWSAKTNAGIAENAGKGLRRRCDRGSSQVGFAQHQFGNAPHYTPLFEAKLVLGDLDRARATSTLSSAGTLTTALGTD